MSAIPIVARQPVQARTVVAAMSTLAAGAIGLSVSPLGFVGLLTTEFGWADPHRPSLYAVPALVLGLLAGARLGSRGRGAGPAWWVVAAGALATAAITAGQRLADGNTMWMSNWPGLARPWVMVAAGAVMGATAGALLCAARRAATPVPIAAAFAVGLVVRSGNSWFQARYDVVAALLAVTAAVAVTGWETPVPSAVASPEPWAVTSQEPSAVAAPEPSASQYRRGPWLALGVAALGYAAFTALGMALGDPIASTGSNTADWAGAERAFVLVAAVIAAVLAVLATRPRRVAVGGLGRAAAAPRRVAVGEPGRDAAGPGGHSVGGLDRDAAGQRRVDRAGSARVGAGFAALSLLVLMAGEAAMSIYGSVMYRVPPGELYAAPPPPSTYLPLCWTLLLLPVGLAVVATLSGIRFGRPATGMAN